MAKIEFYKLAARWLYSLCLLFDYNTKNYVHIKKSEAFNTKNTAKHGGVTGALQRVLTEKGRRKIIS